MRFSEVLNPVLLTSLLETSLKLDTNAVNNALAREKVQLRDFLALISPAAEKNLEAMAVKSRSITIRRFGRIISLYSPIYISNECISTCTYCGFSRTNSVPRKTLSDDELHRECSFLKSRGIDDILLVAGEHPKIVNPDYLENCVRLAKRYFSLVSIEVEPLDTEIYRRLQQAGCDGVVCYQETYNKEVYSRVHLGGRKKNYTYRLDTLERAAAAGMRFLGIGSLLGLNDWREEAIALYLHIDHLYRTTWSSHISVSIPRIRASLSGFRPECPVSDRNLVQLVTALRISFPDVGIVLSTREPAELRDHLLPLGITRTSAGSKTKPGGYTSPDRVLEQFSIEDTRDIPEIAAVIRSIGYEPVLKTWDTSLSLSTSDSF